MPQRELFQLDLAPQHRATLQVLLALHVPDADVWTFGSRVNGDAHEGSDLDLVLRDRRDPTQALASLPALRAGLEESGLPMQVEAHDWAHPPGRSTPTSSAAMSSCKPGARRLRWAAKRLGGLGYES
jgi:predicted nucleotidyltransferase